MKQILIIEDDENIRAILTEVLQLENYQVRTAADGSEGKTLLQEGYRPGLILLDMLMPNIDGRAFLADPEVKALRAGIPLIVMSAGTTSDITDYPVLKKPLDVDRFLEKVAKALAGPQG